MPRTADVLPYWKCNQAMMGVCGRRVSEIDHIENLILRDKHASICIASNLMVRVQLWDRLRTNFHSYSYTIEFSLATIVRDSQNRIFDIIYYSDLLLTQHTECLPL